MGMSAGLVSGACLVGASRGLGAFVAAGLAFGLVSGASAQEMTLQNDSLGDGDSVAICPCFVQGEEAAVWLTSPCDGSIVAIQVFWRSFLGGAQLFAEDSLIVYEGGNFPQPGPIKDQLLAPVLTDGGLNEFRFEDENQTIPIDIPVSAGEEFVVSIKFFNDSPGLGPSIVYDTDGITPNSNAVRLDSGQWVNAAGLGVTGDWVIRVVVDCESEPLGSVCLPDGSCMDGVTSEQADLLGGVFNGTGSACSDAPCVGACFVPTTGACVELTNMLCGAVGGTWQGPGTTECADVCPADLDGSGSLNFGDVTAFLTLYGDGDLAADLDGSGALNFGDVTAFLTFYGEGCP